MKETLSDLTLSVQVSILAQTPAGVDAAENNVDYILVGSQIYMFPPGAASQDVSLNILADVRVENVEGFILSVEQTPGSSDTVLPGQNPQTSVFITDSDGELSNSLVALNLQNVHIMYSNTSCYMKISSMVSFK